MGKQENFVIKMMAIKMGAGLIYQEKGGQEFDRP